MKKSIKIISILLILASVFACGQINNSDNKISEVDSIRIADSLANEDSLMQIKKEYENLMLSPLRKPCQS